jgi:hypothetical protein
MSGAITPFPPVWCSVKKKHKCNFTFTFTFITKCNRGISESYIQYKLLKKHEKGNESKGPPNIRMSHFGKE